MARLKRDENYAPVSGGISSTDPDVVLPLKVDASTGRLMVTGTGANTEYTEGDIDTSFTGIIAMAEDSDTAKPLQVDTNGYLKVNVVAGSASSEQYTDGTAVNASYKGNIVLGTDGTNYQVLAVDSDGQLQVDILTLPSNVDIRALSKTTDEIYGVLRTDAGVAYDARDRNWTITETVNISDGGGSLTIDGSVTLGTPTDGTYIGDVKFGESLPAGTNNIGDVDVVSQPARSATTDTITAKLATDTIQNGTTALTPKFAVIDVATNGDNTIVSAVTGKKIRVLQYSLVCGADTTVQWYSGSSVGTALTGDMSFAANSGIVEPFCPVGLFETVAGEALVLNLSASNSVSGSLVYIEV